MKMEVHLQQRLEQRLHLSQQMLQNLELLQLPIMDLRELIVKELQENPTLEEKQDVDEAEPTTPDDAAETPREAVQREMLESVEDQWVESERRTRRTDSAEDAERRMEMLNNLCAQSASLRDHLGHQISILEVPPETRAFAEHVLEGIDDAGYLRLSSEDLAASLPEELKKDPHEVLVRKIEHAIALVQTLEPRGVGARSLKECLLLQLDHANASYSLLRKLIENHMEDVSANRLPKIVRAFMADPETLADLGYSGEPDPASVLDDIKVLIAEISRLNPKPGTTYSSDKIPKVYPEVVIKQVDGKFEIMLEDGWLPPISVNRNYEEMVRERKPTVEERERLNVLLKSEALTAEERDVVAPLLKRRRLIPEERERVAALAKNGKLPEEDRRMLEALIQETRLSREEREFLKQKMDAGRKLISAIEQRRGTIYRITGEILKHQIEFFENGIEHLRPLKMQEVADAVGIHLSTVSRAISDKWVETPRGIFPLKFFFASAAPKTAPNPPGFFSLGAAPNGVAAPDEQTRLALLEKIRTVIEGEDKKSPMSDIEIVERLKRNHGVTAARRTIAKYREELGIPSSRLRKQY